MEIDEVQSVLRNGAPDWEALIGLEEGPELEFKGTPPLPPGDKVTSQFRRLELAKDVSCLANASGGLIVYGARTAKNANTGADEVESVHPIPREYIDLNRIEATIQEYVYPAIHGLRMRMWDGDDGKGLASIFVPPQESTTKPFIVTEGSDPDGLRLTNYVGVFRRVNASCTADSTEAIYEALRTGRGLQELLGGGPTAAIGAALLEARAAESRFDNDVLDARLRSEAEFVEVAGGPHAYVQARPLQPVDIPTIYDRGWGGMRSVFDDPPSLRASGFSLRRTIPAEVLPSGGLRRRLGRDATVSLLADGLATLVIGPVILGWANDKSSGTRGAINQIALVEMVLEFCRFFVSVVAPATVPPLNHLEWRIGYQGLDEEPNRIVPGWPIERFFYGQPHLASSREFDARIRGTVGAPGRHALELLQKFYGGFGLGSDAIPFVRDGEISGELLAAH